MSEVKKLLEIRKLIKNKKPDFIRQDSHKKKRIDDSWKKPKGMHSQMRHNRSGYRKLLQVGYGSPRLVRGAHPSGLKAVGVANANELSGINPKEEGILIKNIGLKKKIEIIKEAEKKGIKILNVKDPKKFITDAEADMKKRKEKSLEKMETRKHKKITERKKEKEEAVDEETKKEEEKKEKDKLLIKRDAQ